MMFFFVACLRKEPDNMLRPSTLQYISLDQCKIDAPCLTKMGVACVE